MRPVVGIVADLRTIGLHANHAVADKYVRPLVELSDVTPLLIPATDIADGAEGIIDALDGLFVPGGYSNVQRQLYGVEPAPEGEDEDPARDKSSMHLIKAALAASKPVFGVCRGIQEVNVLLGGTLHPRLHEVEGRMDHREDKDAPIGVQYGPAHSVDVIKGGYLEDLLSERRFMVNTVHGQGIDRLAEGLTVEAVADDGTIEAVTVTDAKNYAVFVQWHPEWKASENPQSRKLYQAFGMALRR